MKKIVLLFIFILSVLMLVSAFFYWNMKNYNIDEAGIIAMDDANNFKQINVDDFKKELKTSGVILIDVRTSEELSLYGKIDDEQILININDNDFSSKIMKLSKLNKYLIYCWHGNRSQTARDFMENQGFKYVKDLRGGIDAWTRAGENVVK